MFLTSSFFQKLGFTASPCSSETLQERSVRLKQKYFQIIPSSGMYEDYKKKVQPGEVWNNRRKDRGVEADQGVARH